MLGLLLQAPFALAAFGLAAREHAEGFGWMATARATAEVYGEAVAAAHAPRRLALAATS